MGCGCMNLKDGATWDDADPIDHDCNCIYTPYCDGASFSGYRAAPWPVPGRDGEALTFRGIRNFDALMDGALERGLGGASEFVLTGGSAGGLSTFLHLDRAAARLAGTPARVTGAPVVGFFLDHDDFAKDAENYTAWMQYIYGMQNLTFGADGGLDAACGAAFPDDPHYCFMSPHSQRFVATPFFVFNSKFDAWQIDNELGLQHWNTSAETAAVVAYGADFDAAFAAVAEEPKHGGFITTCICHGCSWGDLELDGRNAYQHYNDWYAADNATSFFTIDGRGPNGDGDLATLGFCQPFPKN